MLALALLLVTPGTGAASANMRPSVTIDTIANNTWYFAEGTTREGFDEWLTVQNPGDGGARVTVTFTGDTLYLPSSDSGTLAVEKETVDITYTGATRVRRGQQATFSASITEQRDGHPGDLSKVTSVTFTLYDSSGNVLKRYSARVTVLSPGVAAAQLTTAVTLSPGVYTVKVVLEDNPYYAEDQEHPATLVVER